MVAFETHPAGLAALENNGIDAYFGDQSILFQLYFESKKADSLVISDNVLTVEEQGLVLPRGDSGFPAGGRSCGQRPLPLRRDEAVLRRGVPGRHPRHRPEVAVPARSRDALTRGSVDVGVPAHPPEG